MSNKMTRNQKLLDWVEEMAQMCQPDSIYWCDGSQEENDRLLKEMVESGAATELNPEKNLAATFSAVTHLMLPALKIGLI